MRNLLVLAQNACPLEPKAGHRLAFEFAKETARRGSLDVVLLINCHDKINMSAWTDIGANIVYCERFNRTKKVAAIIKNIFSAPPRFCTRKSRRAYGAILDLTTSYKYDEVIFEFSQALPYVKAVNNKNNSITIASIHDVQLQLVLRSGFCERLLFSGNTYKYENTLINSFKLIYTLCNKDRDVLKGLYLASNVIVRPPVISNSYSLNKIVKDEIEKGSMVFWGAMDRKENDEAAKYFILNILPLIKKKVCNARFTVVGNKPSKSLTRLASESVVITGFVNDPLVHFNKAQLGVVPLLRGAGVKIKTLEMLSAGLPVVATPVGAEGIDKCRGLTVVSLDDFADKLIDLISDTSELG